MTSDPVPTRPFRRALPATAIALAVLGAGALAAAALAPLSGSPTPAASTAATPAPASASPGGEADAPQRVDDAEARAHTPIAELADPAWLAATATAFDIPERALAAYAGAAVRTAEDDPACGLGWNTLAAIGFVESEHGTIHGSIIGSDGVAAPSIIGIALDGVETERIVDTDGGLIDGDATWDRAVGPLQFIPTTWAQYGQDGNGDGMTDIHHIDDAALAAAVYLCAAGDLTDPATWIAAIDAYNPSIEYNHRVADAANRYAGSL